MDSPVLRFMHISDLHFSNHVDTDDEDAVHSFARLAAIEDFLAHTPVDKVVVTGDLTDAGDRNSLILAKAWLLNDIPCGGDRRCGLRRPPETLALVPGNHDAFNIRHPANGESISAWAQRVVQNRQRSLEHFNRIFPEHAFDAEHGCRYEFLRFGNRTAFFAYVDTCFLGDSLEDPPSRIEQIALGDIARHQVRQLLDWFSAGVAGHLPYRAGLPECIPETEFAACLKILVAHHYLLPPRGYRKSAELRLRHRRAIFTDLASADFDVYLSGHKHVADTWSSYYGDHFDKRGRITHVLNLFRRAFKIGLLPYKLKDERGKSIGRKLATLFYLVGMWRKHVQPAPAEEQEVNAAHEVRADFIEDLVRTMKNGISEPSTLINEMAVFVAAHKVTAEDEFEKEEIEEIQSALRSRFSPAEREKLKVIAEAIHRLALEVASRPFLHVVCGTTGKRSLKPHEVASFNLYSLADKKGEVEIQVDEYHWDESRGVFNSPRTVRHVVRDNHKAFL